MSFAPRLEHDPEADAVYVYLSPHEESARTQCLDDLRMVDYGPTGELVGVELLHVSGGVDLTGVPEAITVQRLLAEYGIPIRIGV
jgi:uncharacterized protein YuzE